MAQRGLTWAVMTGGLLLAACNGGIGTGNDSAGNASAPAAAVGDAKDARISAYTKAYNDLIDTFGLPKTADSYEEAEIAGKSPGDSISITDGWLEAGLAELKKVRATPGALPAVDAAADQLIGALDKVMTRLKPLEAYYESRAYRGDALARGKREDAAMKAEFTAALASLERFNEVLSLERRVRDVALLAAMKRNGDILGYNNKLALQQAEELVDLFDKPEDVRDRAKIARADALVAELEKTLADQRAAYAAARAKASAADAPDTGYSSVVETLTSLIGDYRDVQQSGDPGDVNDMISDYNRAVDSANDID